MAMEGQDEGGVMRLLAETAATGDPVARLWKSFADEELTGRHDGSVLGNIVALADETRGLIDSGDADAAYFLHNNIALQLQSARLALLRGEQAIFEQTLDDASAVLNNYFDVDSAQVISALQTIAEIRNSTFTTAVPDISVSLQRLRQIRRLRETTE